MEIHADQLRFGCAKQSPPLHRCAVLKWPFPFAVHKLNHCRIAQQAPPQALALNPGLTLHERGSFLFRHTHGSWSVRFVGWADWVDCRCFLSFVFLGVARRLELSPCNTHGSQSCQESESLQTKLFTEEVRSARFCLTQNGFMTQACVGVFCLLRGGVGLEYGLVSLGLHCFLRLERALCWK